MHESNFWVFLFTYLPTLYNCSSHQKYNLKELMYVGVKQGLGTCCSRPNFKSLGNKFIFWLDWSLPLGSQPRERRRWENYCKKFSTLGFNSGWDWQLALDNFSTGKVALDWNWVPTPGLDQVLSQPLLFITFLKSCPKWTENNVNKRKQTRTTQNIHIWWVWFRLIFNNN